MIFHSLPLAGAFIIEAEPVSDERGSFSRLFCASEFADAGLDACVSQCNTSFNRQRGTLRGMHYQIAPYAESKLIRCTRGALYDVIIDLRRESETFRSWLGTELRGDVGRLLYVPKGFAHGFLTLEDATEVYYQMSENYQPDFARGVRWDDPAFSIGWPDDIRIVSSRDRSYPSYAEMNG